MDSLESTMTKHMSDLIKQKDSIILEQLGDLIERGLLVVEETQPVVTMYEDFASNKRKLHLSQMIRLVPKEKEYIEKLEKELKVYKDFIKTMQNLPPVTIIER